MPSPLDAFWRNSVRFAAWAGWLDSIDPKIIKGYVNSAPRHVPPAASVSVLPYLTFATSTATLVLAALAVTHLINAIPDDRGLWVFRTVGKPASENPRTLAQQALQKMVPAPPPLTAGTSISPTRAPLPVRRKSRVAVGVYAQETRNEYAHPETGFKNDKNQERPPEPRVADANGWNKKTILTVNQAIQVPNKVLPPGKYVIRLLDSPSDRHIVQIFNAEETHLETTILAIPNYRLEPTGKTVFSFWETPLGEPKAMRAWYYPGDNYGQEFAYPKSTAVQIAAVAHATVPTTEVQKQSEMATAPVATINEEGKETPMEQNADVAQTTPAPAPAPAVEPTPAPSAPEPAPAPQELPATASPLLSIALIGLLALGISALLHVIRVFRS